MPQSPYHFFLAHARYSYNPANETPFQGRQRCAVLLAEAEKRARNAGASFEWEQDDITSEEFSNEKPFYPLWVCLARDANGGVFASLGGIDFGRDREPWGDPYRRVVEAELAAELPIDKK